MKLKPSEAVFIVICLIASAAAICAVAISRGRSGEELKVSLAESEEEQYDISTLNEASAEDFMQIHGIGEVKARAIIEYRTAIGGFKRVSQLRDISGISDSTMALIFEHFYGKNKQTIVSETVSKEVPTSESKNESQAPRQTSPPVTTAPPETTGEASMTVAERVMREVNINEATADEIAEALLITPELAEKITALREEIGYFSSVQELYLCEGFNDKIYKSVKNYIKIGE